MQNIFFVVLLLITTDLFAQTQCPSWPAAQQNQFYTTVHYLLPSYNIGPDLRLADFSSASDVNDINSRFGYAPRPTDAVYVEDASFALSLNNTQSDYFRIEDQYLVGFYHCSGQKFGKLRRLVVPTPIGPAQVLTSYLIEDENSNTVGYVLESPLSLVQIFNTNNQLVARAAAIRTTEHGEFGYTVTDEQWLMEILNSDVAVALSSPSALALVFCYFRGHELRDAQRTAMGNILSSTFTILTWTLIALPIIVASIFITRAIRNKCSQADTAVVARSDIEMQNFAALRTTNTQQIIVNMPGEVPGAMVGEEMTFPASSTTSTVASISATSGS